MGLGSFFKRDKKKDNKVSEEDISVVIDQSKCLNEECQKCIYACTSGVFISVDGKTIVNDASRCGRCFRCQAVCPSEAILIN